jgi:hypothetical protein
MGVFRVGALLLVVEVLAWVVALVAQRWTGCNARQADPAALCPRGSAPDAGAS